MKPPVSAYHDPTSFGEALDLTAQFGDGPGRSRKVRAWCRSTGYQNSVAAIQETAKALNDNNL